MDFRRFKTIQIDETTGVNVAAPAPPKRAPKQLDPNDPAVLGEQVEGKTTLYNDGDAGGFKQWSVWVDGDSFTVEWGHCGHKLQKKTTKTRTEALARFQANKLIRQKRKSGYRDNK